MNRLLAAIGLFALCVARPAPAQSTAALERLRDPVTGREIVRYVSPGHEPHHYYFVSPWSPAGDKLLFFRFDDEVEKLTATGRYPGALWVMNGDGGERRRLTGSLLGRYHVGVNQLWRPDGKAILFVRHDPRTNRQWLPEVDVESGEDCVALDAEHVPAGHPSHHPRKPHLVVTDCYGGEMGNGVALITLRTQKMTQLVTVPPCSRPEAPADERFEFPNWGIWFPPRKYLNEPRPVWNHDGSKILYTSEESGRMHLYAVDTSDR